MEDDSKYKDWKKGLNIWQALTGLKSEKQGPAVYMTLRDKPKEAVLELEVNKIGGVNDVKIITDRLDKIFLKDEIQSTYLAYEKLEKIKKAVTMSITDIVEFARLDYKIKVHKMVLPDDELAYRVLKSANLSAEQQQVARATTTEFKYDTTVPPLKKIFGDSVSASTISTEDIKVKPVYYGESYRRKLSDLHYTRKPNYTENIQQDKKQNQRHFQKSRKTNPPDHSGKPSRCSICESNFHWARNCPHAFENMTRQWSQNNGGRKNANGNNTDISLFTNIQYDELQVLVGESFYCVLVDSGCTQTACGESWYNCYKENLIKDEVSLIKEVPSLTKFKFGNRNCADSLKKVIIPTELGSGRVNIYTDVISKNIPLLLRKNAMKKVQALLDFKNDSILIFG